MEFHNGISETIVQRFAHGEIIDLIDDNEDEYPEPVCIEIEDDHPIDLEKNEFLKEVEKISNIVD
jgi:hypothetical protein